MTSRTPRSTPTAVPGALLVGLLLIGVAVVAVRDLVVAQGWSAGTPWVLTWVRALDGLTASVGVMIVAGVIILVGLLLVWLALKPARRTHLRGRSEADLWLSPAALAALARSTADRTAGVISAETPKVGRRRITVQVLTRRDAAQVTGLVEEALTERVRGLTDTTIVVRTKQVDQQVTRQLQTTPSPTSSAPGTPSATATPTTQVEETSR